MDENDETSKDTTNSNRTQEIFQRAQETQAEHRFPANPPGIVSVPRGSRGPRSLYLRRHADSFGFTLRHFIVYPPESIAEDDGRHAACGALLAPMDTIFVKQVRERSPARQAGLQRGDRIVAVNGVPTASSTYQQVVHRIASSPDYLHLLVVPKEEDVLQRFFPDTAYNPISNQPQAYPEGPVDRTSAQQILTQRIAQQQKRAAAQGPEKFRVDAASWRYLHQPYFCGYDFPGTVPQGARVAHPDQGKIGHQKSAESVLQPSRRDAQEIYAEIRQPNEVQLRQKSRAGPQVPLFKKMGQMGRRASEGSTLLSSTEYHGAQSLASSDGGFSDRYYINDMKAMYKPNYLPSGNDSTPGQDGSGTMLNANCRLSMDVERRESTSSLSSSIADSSKESLASFGSNSTLTGHEMDDSVIMSRFRQSVKQKEEFLRTPGRPAQHALIRREFYGRPKKLERAVWPPPNEAAAQQRSPKPTNQNFARVKNDIDGERECVGAQLNGQAGGVAAVAAPNTSAHSPKEWMTATTATEMAREASLPPDFEAVDDKRTVVNYILAYLFPTMYPNLQVVHKRAKEFETGSDDNRTDFSRSELARLSSKKLVPNVCERAHEYETKAITDVTKRDAATPASTVPIRKIQKDSRSLDSSGSNTSASSINELLFSGLGNRGLSGNVIISTGSKFIHCPPPVQESSVRPTDLLNSEPVPFRPRSNSAESWIGTLKDTNTSKDSRPSETIPQPPPLPPSSPLIPEPVVEIQLAVPTVSITPAPPVRPTQLDLDLDRPRRPVRTHHPKSVRDPNRLSVVIPTNQDDRPVVVKRRIKNTNLADDDRVVRRESYLKATEGGRMHIDSDFSEESEISPQALRSDSASGSSSNASLDREKESVSPGPHDKFGAIREGIVHCKVLEIDGKRAADRSWKQAMIVLKGPKLFLYKDRHHQSPISTSDISLDQSLAGGVDMRTSVVRVAEDYTKRKNVLRVSAVKPCRSEFLLQAESTENFADWVKTLQEQVAVSTEAELDASLSRQQAVPQLVPASTSIQVQGSHLSPQLNAKSGGKATAIRNRSPTGQSPVSKTRKPSTLTTTEHVAAATTSPKSKTWRGRVVKQFKKFNQGAHSPSSPTAPEGSTFGIPIEDCIPSNGNACVPRFVEVCTEIIDEKGLQTVGIYRVPGNNASITALTEEINRNYEDVPLDDQRWNDLHVVSSLLKSYFRKMPDSLVTSSLYPLFIKSDKIEEPKTRMEELRRLVRALPKHNYHTLKHVVHHLKRVADNSNVNKMEAKNLAIVFGPTIVRPECETMENMVNNMTSQCKIVESLITNADWFFPDHDDENMSHMVPLALPDNCDEFEPNNQVLLNNISKYEALKDQKEKNGALLSSLISAAQRKVMRKPSRTTAQDTSREEPTTPTSPKPFAQFPPVDSKNNGDQNQDSKGNGCSIPVTVVELEKRDRNKPSAEKMPWFNYSTDKDEFHRRIESFKQETEAMLQRPRKTEISVTKIESKSSHLSSSASNVNQTSRLSMKPSELQPLTKTHSAQNVFARNPNNNRNSFNPVQYAGNAAEMNNRYSYNASGLVGRPSGRKDDVKTYREVDSVDAATRYCLRRGSSVENVNSGISDSNLNNGLKKVKYENESDGQRRGSFDSLNKLQTEDESLLSTMTKLIDQKLKEKSSRLNILSDDDIPYADESPDKRTGSDDVTAPDKGTASPVKDLYKNPSLHKSNARSYRDAPKEQAKRDKEKEVDTQEDTVPDNERHISLTLIASKLKRSESLNKPPPTTNNKVKRSESLNKTGDKLKRSDSLTKTEKTESNINKRRELGRKLKESTKNKRKNGAPDRSIKRRHTVGGTKDPDKVTWVMDTAQKREDPRADKERGLRTSSPDLSSTRRERFFFEINLIGPENMVVALRQHLIGSRPQSFPESTVFKVPLESHV
ncbi:rho GTPase-activating protein 21-like isoform X3 [Cylas formicarius]|uniref:rho GTPase-activating protein 21-like isoform X3 n=1 Tax=Cylas formicarius TaxID=197179 RepID=UPI0029584E6E|nr:rho GTPase-activating protein 21-like isoform X3 [Cylas formicarius]